MNFFLSFKKQIDTYCEKCQELSTEIMEKEKELLIKNHEFEENKKRTYEILDIINKDIEETRKELENLKKEHIAGRIRLKILEEKNMCARTTKCRKELKKLRKFLNQNRGWLCLENCKTGPECEYCTLIFQINYTYSCNKKADMNTFRKSILRENFERLVEIWEDFKNRQKWVNYNENWTNAKRRPIFVCNFLHP